jgi:hypothetical protein
VSSVVGVAPIGRTSASPGSARGRYATT